jgi:hypothetical protein
MRVLVYSRLYIQLVGLFRRLTIYGRGMETEGCITDSL